MVSKELCLLLLIITTVTSLPTIAVPNPNLQPLVNPSIVAQPRTFGTLSSLFGGNQRYPEAYRGYGYGSSYGYPAYQGVVAAGGYPSPYGGYGWRGSTPNRGYAQSGWANGAPSGWAG